MKKVNSIRGNNDCILRLGIKENVNKFHPRKTFGLSKLFDDCEDYDQDTNKEIKGFISNESFRNLVISLIVHLRRTR